MSYELIGQVKTVMPQQTFDSGFTKREFVVTTPGKYPNDIKLECLKDKCALLDNISSGQEVKVAFNVRGNEYKGKYYVNLVAQEVTASPAAQTPSDDDNMPF